MTEEFIEKSQKIHGYKYDYSNVIFTKMNDKVIIICKTHCEFEQTPSNHIYMVMDVKNVYLIIQSRK